MDVEKTMQFILEQHAAFSAGLVEQKDRLNLLGEHVKMLATTAEHMLTVQQEHETWLARLTESQTRQTESQTRLTESQTHLAESHTRLAESHTQLAASHAQLANLHIRVSDKQDRNEDAINVLIRMVQDILPRLPKQ